MLRAGDRRQQAVLHGPSPGEDAVTVSMKIFNGRYDVDRSYTYRIRVQ